MADLAGRVLAGDGGHGASSGTMPDTSEKFHPLWLGTVVFAAIAVFLCLVGQGLRFGKFFSRGEASLCAFLVTIAATCMWMMWAMTWLSQVNPVLYPFMQGH
mmetsp:Transcript_7465/g.21098  ORF Transcript_7465/g.21098 Transcript_7465/m.21098 type:complete len:102 (-) Transcript_7465:44-349(-)